MPSRLRRQVLVALGATAALIGTTPPLVTGSSSEAGTGGGGMDKLNVLLVLLDDMRADTASYGSEEVRTPALDALAEQSVQFNQAHAAIAKCGPSRVSLLTSRTPYNTEYYYHTGHAAERGALRDSLTLPGWFREQGYRTYGTSKVFHFEETNQAEFDVYRFQPVHLRGQCRTQDRLLCRTRSRDLTDSRAIDWAKNRLGDLQDSPDPWFLAVGLRRPHLRYEYPVDFEEGAPPLQAPAGVNIPEGMPEVARRGTCAEVASSHELRVRSSRYGAESDIVEPESTAVLRAGYFRSVEWVDSLIGDLLEHLRVLGMADSTLVVVGSDHGFNLGENGQWCKMSLTETATRVPLWIRHPQGPAGAKIAEPVQLLDLFPTIADLAGVPLNAEITRKYKIDGRSFAPLVVPDQRMRRKTRLAYRAAPTLQGFEWSWPVFGAAFSIVQRCAVPGCEGVATNRFWSMGFSVRTKRFRYTEWRTWLRAVRRADWEAAPEAVELYDLENDPLEQVNIAEQAASTSRAKHLARVLRTRNVACSRNEEGNLVHSAASCAARGEHCHHVAGLCQLRSDCTVYALRGTCKSNALCKWSRRLGCLLRSTRRMDVVGIDTFA